MGDFLDRFQGKISAISKDGYIGVITKTNKPIEKRSDSITLTNEKE